MSFISSTTKFFVFAFRPRLHTAIRLTNILIRTWWQMIQKRFLWFPVFRCFLSTIPALESKRSKRGTSCSTERYPALRHLSTKPGMDSNEKCHDEMIQNHFVMFQVVFVMIVAIVRCWSAPLVSWWVKNWCFPDGRGIAGEVPLFRMEK